MAVDSEDGYVEHVQVRPANEAEDHPVAGHRGMPSSRGVVAVLARQGLCQQGQPAVSAGARHRGSDPAQGSWVTCCIRCTASSARRSGHPLQGGTGVRDDETQVQFGAGAVLWDSKGAGADVLGGLGDEPLKAHRKLKAMELAGVGVP